MATRARKKQPKLPDLIRQLNSTQGSRKKLLEAMIRIDPGLTGMRVDQIGKWIDGESHPNYQQASALAVLIQPRSDEFWAAYGDRDKRKGAGKRKSLPKRPPEEARVSVYGISWIGSRTEDLEAMCSFYEDVLGLHQVHRCEHDHAIFRTDNGDYVALYGPSTKRYGLFKTGPVVGFRVANIIAARSEMERHGVKFLGPIHSREKGRWKYCHYVAADGNVYEIVEEKPWADIE